MTICTLSSSTVCTAEICYSRPACKDGPLAVPLAASHGLTPGPKLAGSPHRENERSMIVSVQAKPTPHVVVKNLH
ncbi:hypothetical protein N656DRAFT_544283 [Canariomyces notabilis]|uniref:Uncharacterized protein n=1 Tax=Canariomyces notabilis TaxID=2074819 RepID=A0AAN6THT2_9PEZI|nr:hypothetical protein N656DRAFT_544283 [Canariomyces arenarius]